MHYSEAVVYNMIVKFSSASITRAFFLFVVFRGFRLFGGGDLDSDETYNMKTLFYYPFLIYHQRLSESPCFQLRGLIRKDTGKNIIKSWLGKKIRTHIISDGLEENS